MIGLGTLINVVAILGGATIGRWAGSRFSQSHRDLTTDVLGLVTLLSGIMSAFAVADSELGAAVGDSWGLLIVLGSLLIGGFIGQWIGIEDRLELIGENVKRRLNASEGDFALGFVTASLVFCIGPLAILGAFDDAMGLGLDKLFLKSSLDFFASAAFAATFGWGVAGSAVSVGIYQGAMTLLGWQLGAVLNDAQIAAMSAVGGLLLIGIGLRLLRIREIAVGNLLPALFIAPLAVGLIALI